MSNNLSTMKAKLAELEMLRIELYGQEAVDKYEQEHKPSLLGKKNYSKEEIEELTKKHQKVFKTVKILNLFSFITFLPPFSIIIFILARKCAKLAPITKYEEKKSRKYYKNSISYLISNVFLIAIVLYIAFGGRFGFLIK